jgi:hypothetical protein
MHGIAVHHAAPVTACSDRGLPGRAITKSRGDGPLSFAKLLRFLTGVVTLSQIERRLPTTAYAEPWNFNDLACCSIAKIWLVSLNVTTPVKYRLPAVDKSINGRFGGS